MDLVNAKAVHVVPSSDEIVVVTVDGHIAIYDGDNSPQEDEFWVKDDDSELLQFDFVCCKQDRQLAISRDGQVFLRGEGKPAFQVRRDKLLDACLSHDGNLLALLYGNECKIVDASSGSSIRSVFLGQDKSFQLEDGRVALLKHDEELVVLNVLENKVDIFGKDGRLQESWGGKGNMDDEFDRPCSMAADSQSHLIIADYNNNRVQVFTREGELIHSFHDDGRGELLVAPTHVSLDFYDNVFIVFNDNQENVFLGWEVQNSDDEEEEEVKHEEEKDTFDESKFIDEKSDVKVRILRGRNIINGATLQPFVKVNLYKEGQCDDPEGWVKTHALEAPPFTWDSTLNFRGKSIKHYSDSMIRVELWDAEEDISDKFVGGLFIEGLFTIENLSKPRWYRLRDEKGELCGELELSVSIAESKGYSPVLDHSCSRVSRLSAFDGSQYSIEELSPVHFLNAESKDEEEKKLSPKREPPKGPSEDCEGLIRDLVHALVNHHSSYRRIESLARMASGSAHLREMIIYELNIDGFRALTMLLESRSDRTRQVAFELLNNLVPMDDRAKQLTIQGLDWPGLYLTDQNLYFFYIPDRFRQQYASRMDDEDLCEENYVKYLRSLLGNANLQTDHHGGIIAVEDDFHMSRALAFRVETEYLQEKIVKKQQDMSWAHGTRLKKLYHRFQAFKKKRVSWNELLEDPLVNNFVDVSTAMLGTSDKDLSWNELRNHYWFQTYAVRQKGHDIVNYREDVELLKLNLGIQGRSVTCSVINVRNNAHNLLNELKFLCQVRNDELDLDDVDEYVCTHYLDDKIDGLLLSQDELEQLVHRLRFEGDDSFRHLDDESKREQNYLWLVKTKEGSGKKKKFTTNHGNQMDQETRKKELHNKEKIDHVKELIQAMPEVAQLWNEKKRMEACRILLEKAPAVIPLIPRESRDIRLRLIHAIKKAKLYFSEERTIRLWKACEIYLRCRQEGTSTPRTTLKMNKELFEKNKQRMERLHVKQVDHAYQILEIHNERYEARKKEQVELRQRARHETVVANQEKMRKAEERRQKEAILHAQWYKEEARLRELQHAMVEEKKRKEDAQRAQARIQTEMERKKILARNKKLQERKDRERVRKDRERVRRYEERQKRLLQEAKACDDFTELDSPVSVPSQLHFDKTQVDQDVVFQEAVKDIYQDVGQHQQELLETQKDDLFKQVKWEEVTDFVDLPKSATVPPTSKPSMKLRREIRRAKKYQMKLEGCEL